MRATCLTTLGIHKSSQSAKDQTQNEITGCFINSVTKFQQFNLNNDINTIDLNCHLLFRIASNRYSLRHQTRYVSFLHNSGAQYYLQFRTLSIAAYNTPNYPTQAHSLNYKFKYYTDLWVEAPPYSYSLQPMWANEFLG